ncbi:MAG: lipoyl(octanoyl) transferase [Campylobacterota bacterium]|nr:lipoyl(octanoyl) transferase [Campylobacterota bacterium]
MFDYKKWRFIKTGVNSAYWNMAVDEALIRNLKDDDLPIFRIYGWENSISIGRFSNIKKLDKKIDFVRRITGGGMLAHGNDISYSIVLPRRFLKNHGVKESYNFLCRFLINLYKVFGKKAQFAFEKELEIKKSDICLAGLEEHDIVIDGKKIGGNAQRHTKTVVFQHGSIPISFNRVEFDGVVSLKELGILISFDELSDKLKESFVKTFEVAFVDDSLTLAEEKDAREFFLNKYTKDEWNIDAKNK